MGLLTKTATVFPGNRTAGQPMIGGGVMLFDDATGALAAVIDFHLITKWKTAGDSLVAALGTGPGGGAGDFDCRRGHRGALIGGGLLALGFLRPVLASGTGARRLRRFLHKKQVPRW